MLKCCDNARDSSDEKIGLRLQTTTIGRVMLRLRQSGKGNRSRLESTAPTTFAVDVRSLNKVSAKRAKLLKRTSQSLNSPRKAGLIVDPCSPDRSRRGQTATRD